MADDSNNDDDESMSMATPGKSAEADPERPPPRLLITKMELENFKSYAGIQEIGPFHKCFSAVVGPNGSGKSNVIDALLFVFGKRAKKLRLNKVSQLIHHSDAVAPEDPPLVARVAVYFQEIVDTGDGDQDYELVPGTETVITRMARSDNSSIYKIDGRNCQFKDVAAYLGRKGIDLDNNRFLILQGEVEMISLMPPKGKNEGDDDGLLEYLEDIIGSSKYVPDTQEAAAAVEALTEQRQEKLNRVKAVEKEKDSLEGAKLEAEALLKKDVEIRRQQNILFQIHSRRAATAYEKHAGKMSAVQEQLTRERERLDATDARVAELEHKLFQEKQAYDQIHTALVQSSDEFAAYERRDIKLREEIKHGKQQKKKLEAKVVAQTEKEQECQQKALQAEESIPVWEEKIATLTQEKAQHDAALEKIHDDMKGVTQQLRSQLEAKTQELAPVHQERAVFQASLDTATTEVKLLEDGVTRAQEKLVSAEAELAAIDQKQEAKRQELAEAEDELAQANDRIVEAEAEEKVLVVNEGKLSERYTQLMAQAEEAKAALQASGSSKSSPVLKRILEAARPGGELQAAGVVGRLGDLATIPDKYDVAVSTACGHLDSIVVQTTAGAQKCLKFLRKYDIGRASFIPLDKMQKGAHDRQVETPENAPRLYDLIQPKRPYIAPAVFNSVQNTLVAPDLETGTRWAYDYDKRWRVVTLDGKLIEASGTMSGGGKSVRRGGMKLASGAKAAVNDDGDEAVDVETIEKEAANAQHLLQECRGARKEVAEEIRNLKKRIKQLETLLPKLAVEIGGCDTTREELTKFIPELRSQCELSEEDAATLAATKQKVSKCKTDMASCTMKASKLESEVARLQKAIMDAGGSKLKKQQEACEKALSTLNAAEKALGQARVSITSMNKAAGKAQKAKADAEKELEQCLAKTEELQVQFKALERDAFVVMEKFEEAKAVELEARRSFEEATQEVENLKKSHADFKCIEVELLGKVADLEKQMSDCEHTRKKWESDLTKLRAAAEEDEDLDLSDDEEDDEGAEEDDNNSKASSATEDEATAKEDVNMEDVPDAAPPQRKRKSTTSGLPVFSSEALQKYSKDEITATIKELENERNTIAKHANMGAIAEYRKKEADYLSRVSELDSVTEERNNARRKHEDLRRQRLEMFMDGFGQITLKLKEMYQMITLGGDAELELVDSLDPFSEGIVFSVRPPKKSWKNISNLSGGEKTLSSLALVFALHHFKPTPLYVMDEIDAALDFKNVSIVANYIKERTRNAQFIIISLRNNMFELADRLVGIYKTNNCTKSVSINPRAFGASSTNQNGLVPSAPTPSALAERRANTDKRQGENDFDSPGPAFENARVSLTSSRAKVMTPQEAG